MDINDYWNTIQKVFEDTYDSSVHYAIATVNNYGQLGGRKEVFFKYLIYKLR